MPHYGRIVAAMPRPPHSLKSSSPQENFRHHHRGLRIASPAIER